jgi:uncharacterized protein YabN with tetrapyrrole methylase and pyrophosphatase domain
LRRCRNICPWTKEQSIESYAQELIGEVQEMMQAIEHKDNDNLKEELGDLLWDVLMVAHIAEDHGLFKVEEVMEDVVAKMRRRKPYVFEGKQVTIEEAGRLWEEVKRKEKQGIK